VTNDPRGGAGHSRSGDGRGLVVLTLFLLTRNRKGPYASISSCWVQRVLSFVAIFHVFRPDDEDNDEGLDPVRPFAVWHLPITLPPPKSLLGCWRTSPILKKAIICRMIRMMKENKENRGTMRYEPEKKDGHSRPSARLCPQRSWSIIGLTFDPLPFLRDASCIYAVIGSVMLVRSVILRQ
jgi:hypothetical protein